MEVPTMLPALQQRSSWPSSFLTGLIGWNGFIVILGLALGDTAPVGILFLAASVIAVAQVLLLRVAFFALRLDRGVPAGLIWGAISGGALMGIACDALVSLRAHYLAWLPAALYIGLAVGGFLSYFYRDDRRIASDAQGGAGPIDYGRDAHWLEPFGFGAVVYLLVFLPRSLDLAIAALVVGAMSGVVAAGISHFLLFARSRASWLPVLLGVGAGLAQGAISGLLFQRYAGQLALAPLALGAVAGLLTYLTTALRGRALARRELDLGHAIDRAAGR
jgi:hypothetical protein